MSANVLAVLERIANTSADFATTADSDHMVRVGRSLLEIQAADLRSARAAVAELIAEVAHLVGRDATYIGKDILLPMESSGDALATLQCVRELLARVQGGAQ